MMERGGLNAAANAARSRAANEGTDAMESLEPDRLDVQLGEAVRRLRRDRNLSQADLGGAIGVSFQQVQKYERGTNRVSFSTLLRICQALGCSIEDLMAQVDGAGPGRGKGSPTVSADAVATLATLAEIASPAVRRAIVDFARSLAKDAASERQA